MSKVNIYSIIFAILAITNPLLASGDHYERTGKIWSVVIVVSLVIVGFGLILFMIERRIKKIEDKLN